MNFNTRVRSYAHYGRTENVLETMFERISSPPYFYFKKVIIVLFFIYVDVSYSYMHDLAVSCFRSSFCESYPPYRLQNGCYKANSDRINNRIKPLKVKAWYEDDLPNIFGINPIEGAIIFGVLYYIYGPNVLYEYAREAGKLFSTYAPIIKDVTLDIFNEFKDYFEEDRYEFKSPVCIILTLSIESAIC